MRAWWNTLRTTFDPRSLAFFASVYLGLKGGAGGLLKMAMLPLFKMQAGVSSETFQTYSIVVMAPWALKPIAGLADKYTLWGSNKSAYIGIAAIVGTAATAAFAANAQSIAQFPNAMVALAAIANTQIAVTDLLAEGSYAQLMRDAPQSGSALVSYVWGIAFMAQILVAIVAGPVADDGNAHLLIAAAVPLMAQAAVPPLANWVKEERPQKHSVKQWMVKMVVVVVAATGAITAAAVQNNAAVKVAAAATVACTIAAAAWAFMPQTLRGVALYTFVAIASQLQFGGPLDYFYTASEECVRNGPKFSMTFYLTTAPLVAAVCGAAGVAVFETTMSNWTFRSIFRFTTVLMCAVAAVDVVIVTRTNLRWGIPDRAAYLGGNACMGAVVMMMHTVPLAVLTSKMCPDGAETMVYAIVAGMQNLGAAVAGVGGAGIAQMVNVSLSDASCDHTLLPEILIAGTIAMPMLVALPLTWILIPSNVGVRDSLVHDPTQTGTAPTTPRKAPA